MRQAAEAWWSGPASRGMRRHPAHRRVLQDSGITSRPARAAVTAIRTSFTIWRWWAVRSGRGCREDLHRRRGAWASGKTSSMSAKAGPYHRNALSISSWTTTSRRALVTVSVSVRAPQIFCARRTSAGSMSHVFFTGGIRVMLSVVRTMGCGPGAHAQLLRCL